MVLRKGTLVFCVIALLLFGILFFSSQNSFTGFFAANSAGALSQNSSTQTAFLTTFPSPAFSPKNLLEGKKTSLNTSVNSSSAPTPTPPVSPSTPPGTGFTGFVGGGNSGGSPNPYSPASTPTPLPETLALGEKTGLNFSEKIHPSLRALALENPGKTELVLVRATSFEELEKVSKTLVENNASVAGEFSVGAFVAASVKLSKLEKIAEDALVESILPNEQVAVFWQDEIEQISAPAAWESNYSGKNVRVAVLDSGVDSTHQVLSGKAVLEKSFVSNSSVDVLGHGTFVSALILGNRVLENDFSSVAPGAQLLNVKVLNDSGFGSSLSVVQGINYAVENGARIISISFGALSSDQSSAINLAVADAVRQGVIVVTAAGNCGLDCGNFSGVTSPGNSLYAIAVGSVDSNNLPASFSSNGLVGDEIKPDVVAPGVGVLSALPGNSYGAKSGTSVSTALVSGAIALLLEKNSSLTLFEVKRLVEDSATDFGIPGKDLQYGSGFLDVGKLLSTEFNSSLPSLVSVFVPSRVLNGSQADFIVEARNASSVLARVNPANSSDSRNYSFSFDGASWRLPFNDTNATGFYSAKIFAVNDFGSASVSTGFNSVDSMLAFSNESVQAVISPNSCSSAQYVALSGSSATISVNSVWNEYWSYSYFFNAGTYSFKASISRGNVNFYVHSNCGSSPVVSTNGSGATKYFTLNVPSPGYYYFHLVADSWSCISGCTVVLSNTGFTPPAQVCTSHSSYSCSSSNVYWYNSCGTRQGLKEACSGTTSLSFGALSCSSDRRRVTRDKDVTEKTGCSGASCTTSSYRITETISTCSAIQECQSGACVNVNLCSSGYKCNANGWGQDWLGFQSNQCGWNQVTNCNSGDSTGSRFCSNNAFYQPGVNSYCANGYPSCQSNSYTNLVENCNNLDRYDAQYYCKNNDVYRDWIDGGCSAGSTSCSTSLTPTFVTDCGDTTYDSTSNPYCSGNQLVKNVVAHNRGCNSGSCTASDSSTVQVVENCQYGCSSNACVVPKPDLAVSGSDILYEKT
ncbi:S8 family serine peptidase [Candidatus Micrarchaeota archaeon]|nr:S8 family serine peptidase [Candidatus Micrarchaeota archaeon]